MEVRGWMLEISGVYGRVCKSETGTVCTSPLFSLGKCSTQRLNEWRFAPFILLLFLLNYLPHNRKRKYLKHTQLKNLLSLFAFVCPAFIEKCFFFCTVRGIVNVLGILLNSKVWHHTENLWLRTLTSKVIYIFFFF